MHLGFDAKRLFNNYTGLGNYSRTLLRELTERAPEHSYYLFSPRAERNEETNYFFNNPSYNIVKPSRGQKVAWRSWGVKRPIQHHKIDVYHGLSHELPLGWSKLKIPAVVTIHDLIFRHYPRQYRRMDNVIYNYKFRYACREADVVLAISESTKQDIQHFYGTPAEKIKVVYQSCDERFLLRRSPSALEEMAQKYALPTTYSLYVGSLIERKNLLGIVEALAHLPATLRHPLLVVGKGNAYRKQVVNRARQLGVSDLLLFREVSFTDLPVVYQGAQVFLYPSFYEGFGIPVIEALNSGVPVITSDRSSLPEAAGPGSLLVDPYQSEAISEAWTTVLTNAEQTKKMIAAGLAYAERFRADKVVPAVLEIYQALSDQ